MLSIRTKNDEAAAARLLWQVRAIASKEFDSLPFHTKQNLFMTDVRSVSSEESEEDFPFFEQRRRAVSIESMDVMPYENSSPAPTLKRISIFNNRFTESPSVDSVEHHDWSKRVAPIEELSAPSLSPKPRLLLHKYGKRKRDTYVGLETETGSVRATLRKKFSWKQYPELEEYLIVNQDEYFEYSSKNYTAEQRKYNNGLTRGLLELASKEGYVFEDFTFSMVRDRIRCYYKSHSQSAKKKRRR